MRVDMVEKQTNQGEGAATSTVLFIWFGRTIQCRSLHIMLSILPQVGRT